MTSKGSGDLADELIKQIEKQGLGQDVNRIIKEAILSSEDPIDTLIKFVLNAKDKHQKLSEDISREELASEYALFAVLERGVGKYIELFRYSKNNKTKYSSNVS